MIRSRQTAAHMTTEAEVDMSAVDRARAELNERRLAAQQRGSRRWRSLRAAAQRCWSSWT